MKTDPTRKWVDDMILELRMHDVRGTAIGDAVAAVESHCAESGETPAEAFGDPREYARSLSFPDREVATIDSPAWARLLAPIASGLVAINLVGPVIRAFHDHTPMTITWGWLAALVVTAALVWAIVALMPTLLRKMAAFVILFALGVGAVSAIGILWTTPAFHAPGWLGIGLVVALLAYSVVGQRSLDDDPLVDPRSPETSRSTGLLLVTRWLFVIIAAGTALITLVPIWLA